MTGSRVCRYVAATCLWVLTAAPVGAATVTIAWDANPEPDVTGYQVCASTQPGVCNATVGGVGNRLNWTFAGLANNVQYYFLVRAQSATGVSPWAQVPFATPVLPPPGSEQTRSDFNADGYYDILWQHQSNGQVLAWHMFGAQQLTWRFLSPGTVAPGWRIKGSGDINRDGKSDLVWHHSQTGDVSYWLLDGVMMWAFGSFSFPRVDTTWNLVSVRDMNGDANADLLWHNLSSGQLVVWFLNGGTVTGWSFLSPSTIADTRWKAKGAGDFTGDGRADIVWHNEVTGELGVWEMNGVTAVGFHTFSPAAAAPPWKIVGIGDSNRDGQTDILWQHDTNGEVILWVMNGRALSTWWDLTTSPSSVWKVVGPR
jgi:FG-GAP-like repeat